jgi:hypothetical protein
MPNDVVEISRLSWDAGAGTARVGFHGASARTITRLGAGTFVLMTVVLGLRLGSAQAADGVPIRPDLLVYEADAEQVQMTRWAANRFEVAGLQVPEAEVHFHRTLSGCGGYLGYARGGRVDLCTDLADAPARRALLHEMGHIWLDQNLSELDRERFVEMRGLRAWNDSSDTWALRGYEQGAEIMAWALGERILTPQIPDNEPIQLARGFELLTGSAPPAFTEASNDQAPSTHKGVVHV